MNSQQSIQSLSIEESSNIHYSLCHFIQQIMRYLSLPLQSTFFAEIVTLLPIHLTVTTTNNNNHHHHYNLTLKIYKHVLIYMDKSNSVFMTNDIMHLADYMISILTDSDNHDNNDVVISAVHCLAIIINKVRKSYIILYYIILYYIILYDIILYYMKYIYYFRNRWEKASS
jgi:hypothetical protein